MKKILIIEDDEVLRENTTDYLEEEGFKVFSAKNGMEGVQLALEKNPDLILCDIEMPKLKGFDVYKILQESIETNFIPFIFITAKVEKEDIRAGMQIGADDYITKPFDFDELHTTINTRIEKRDKILKATNDNYKALFENSITGIFILKDRKLVYYNTKFSKIIGYSFAEINELNPLSVIVQDDKKLLLQKLDYCLKGIQQSVNVTFRIVHGLKRIIKIKMSAGLTKYNGNKAIIGNIIEIEEKADSNIISDEMVAIELRKAIKIIEDNEEAVSPELFKRLYNIYKINKLKIQKDSNPDKLTGREKEVLQLICKGLSTKDIAENLFLSKRTIDSHRANLASKTGANNIVELVTYAIQNNFIEI